MTLDTHRPMNGCLKTMIMAYVSKLDTFINVYRLRVEGAGGQHLCCFV